MPMSIADEIVGGRLINDGFNAGSIIHRKLHRPVENLQRKKLQNTDGKKHCVFRSRFHLQLEVERSADNKLRTNNGVAAVFAKIDALFGVLFAGYSAMIPSGVVKLFIVQLEIA